MTGPEVPISLPDLDPMQHEPRVSSQNESLIYSVDEGEVVELGVLDGKSPQVDEESLPDRGNSNPGVEWILCEPWVLVRSG